MTRPYRLSAGLAGFFVSAAIGMTACGDSSSPHVASLGKTGGIPSDSTTTLPKGNPTQLLDEWASCMRANGVPDMADPTITSSGAIHITMPADANSNSKVDAGPNGGPCGDYLTAASQALRGGAPIQRPDPAKLLKYSRCMQSNGFPEFPDPSPGGGLSIQIQPGSPMNPNNPTFVSTSKTCSKTAGVPGIGNPASAPRGAIEVQGGSGPAGGPGGNGGSGAVVGTGGTGGNSGLSTSGGKNGA